MNVIVRLLSHEPFIERVAEDVATCAQGHIIFVPSPSGELHGEIKTFRLLGRPLFTDGDSDCIGHTCSLPFSGRAEASGYGETEGGKGWLPFQEEGEYFGHVELSWPDEVYVDTPEQFVEVYPHITINVVLESTGWENISAQPVATDAGNPNLPSAVGP